MAQTTTHVNACDVVVNLDNTAGVLTDISGSSNEVSMDFNNQLGEFRTFGTEWPVRTQCGADATISFNAIYSTTATEAVGILKAWFFTDRDARTIRVDIPNSSVGSDRYTFEVYLESLSIPVSVEEPAPILVSATMKPTGEVTLSTIAS
jgi:hypothetical protein